MVAKRSEEKDEKTSKNWGISTERVIGQWKGEIAKYIGGKAASTHKDPLDIVGSPILAYTAPFSIGCAHRPFY